MAFEDSEWDVKYKIQMKKIDILSRVLELRLKQLEKLIGKDNYDDMEDQLLQQLKLFDDIL